MYDNSLCDGKMTAQILQQISALPKPQKGPPGNVMRNWDCHRDCLSHVPRLRKVVGTSAEIFSLNIPKCSLTHSLGMFWEQLTNWNAGFASLLHSIFQTLNQPWATARAWNVIWMGILCMIFCCVMAKPWQHYNILILWQSPRNLYFVMNWPKNPRNWEIWILGAFGIF